MDVITQHVMLQSHLSALPHWPNPSCQAVCSPLSAQCLPGFVFPQQGNGLAESSDTSLFETDAAPASPRHIVFQLHPGNTLTTVRDVAGPRHTQPQDLTHCLCQADMASALNCWHEALLEEPCVLAKAGDCITGLASGQAPHMNL